MKKILIITLISASVIFSIFVYSCVPKHNIISPGLIEPEQITVNNSALIFCGSIKANSLYGSYNGCKYKIKGDKLFLSIEANETGSGDKEAIYFKINDCRISNVNSIYIVSNINRRKNQKLAWERTK